MKNLSPTHGVTYTGLKARAKKDKTTKAASIGRPSAKSASAGFPFVAWAFRPMLGWTAILVLLLTTASATAQEAADEPEGLFFDQVAVDVVNVEVYVTDKNGNPVMDLERDDFEIFEDRRPVEIVNFYRVTDGEADEVAEIPAAAEPQKESYDLPPIPRLERVIPDSQKLHLIVFVDNFHIHPLNRNRVFQRLRTFLRDTVRPGDEVMVASYDRSLHLRHPFTSDPSLVNATLRELEGFSGVAVERESERADAVKAIFEAQTQHRALLRAKEFSDAGFHELHLALDAVDELIDSLAGLPGRKMLLHVSDGLPMVPGQDLYQAVQQRFADLSALGEAQSRDMSRRFLQLTNNANSNRVSFYTIDAGGLRVTSGMGAEYAAINSPHVVGTAVDGTRRRNLQAPLVLMAERTGGQSVMNTNDVSKGLERFGRDFSNYYSLGYRAPVADRGRFHKIEVRLKNPANGLKLRHREGYRDKSIESRMADSVHTFLVHGYQSNPLGVTVELGPQSPMQDGNIDVAFRVRVPMERLVLLPQADFFIARIRLYFGALDEDGRDAPLQELPYELRIPASAVETARQDEVVRVINATMRPGPQRLVVAVRDEISQERSIVGQFLQVGSS